MKQILLILCIFAAAAAQAQYTANGHISTVVAGEEFPVFSAIYVNADGVAFKAGRTEETRAQGMAIDTAFTAGDTVQILYAGVINDFPDLEEGAKYYVGTTDGTVVDAKPVAEYSQQIGRAVGRSVLLVEPLDINLTGESTIWKSADETRSSTATAAADGELVATLESGVEYAVEATVWLNAANGTMGYKCGLAYTGTVDKAQYFVQRYASGATEATASAGTDLPAAANVAQDAGVGCVKITAYITPSSGGTLSVSWAQATSNAGDLSLLKGSTLKITKK